MDEGSLIISVLLLALAGTLPGWLLSDKNRLHSLGALLGSVVVVGLGIWMVYQPSFEANGDILKGTLTLLLTVLAVFGGGPVTAAALHRVDGGAEMEAAGKILRGGAWIGAMERAAIFTALIAGWPEGLAVVLALKGLGRYPELKHPGAAERFIIGSFASVLWSVACAGVLLAMRG